MQKQTIAALGLVALAGLAVGYFIAGPTTKTTIHKHSHKEKRCDNAVQCDVDIVVECDKEGSPTPATCEAYAEDAELTRISSATKSLAFKIKTGSFKFISADGIRFSNYNGGDRYFLCTANSDQKKYGCTIQGSPPPGVPFKYSIDIENVGVTDPWVVNY